MRGGTTSVRVQASLHESTAWFQGDAGHVALSTLLGRAGVCGSAVGERSSQQCTGRWRFGGGDLWRVEDRGG